MSRGAIDAETTSLLLYEDHCIFQPLTFVSRFQFKAAIHSLENKSPKNKRSVRPWILDLLKPRFSMQPVLHRGPHHGQIDLASELPLFGAVELTEPFRNQRI